MFHRDTEGIHPMYIFVSCPYQDVNSSKATFQITQSLRAIVIMVSVTQGRLAGHGGILSVCANFPLELLEEGPILNASYTGFDIDK